ncbi:MAG: hypothetical protein OMM_09969, partial [Candidatus Magnetoglobus multicellularis str. Araruama]
MQVKPKIIQVIRITFAILLMQWCNSSLYANSYPIHCNDTTLTCNAADLPVSEFERLLYQQCGIRLLGLKAQDDQRITYQAQGPILETMKRLLRYLDAESYVFKFNGEQLTHVLIYSRGKTSYRRPRHYSSQSNNTANKISAVKVLDIVPDSQAEVHGFQKNDYIVEYDSIPIKSASQLVSVVKKRRMNVREWRLCLFG